MGINGEKFEKLMEVMKTLRDPDGCPWDREQSHESITMGFVEELYEFIEAVEDKDIETMKEELGDLCLHIVFQVQIAKENNEFEMAEVLDSIIEKLIRRHPHVFSDTKVKNSDEVVANWDDIKKTEKEKQHRKSVVDGIPRHLPALSKARKVQIKAKKVGFDWDKVEDVILKIKEEFNELYEAIEEKNQEHISEELGDVLFSIVNLSRFLNVEPERALHNTVRKFMNRFRAIETALEKKGKTVQEASFDEMDTLWDEVKEKE
ncbi:MAG: nucleoside triphosphate pyrophosphohydrolase [Chlamydiae bacterium]|nr:MAG: nucleoside triphosphate pyrophosphohydrolase [Chlamydiota bacterium]